jgi:hypothetical protein
MSSGLAAKLLADRFMSTENEPQLDPYPNINVAAVRRHALACSEILRAGKFKRVGSDFLDYINTQAEIKIRQFRLNRIDPKELLGSEENFLHGTVSAEKLVEQLNLFIAETIQRRVRSHPTVGQTLT